MGTLESAVRSGTFEHVLADGRKSGSPPFASRRHRGMLPHQLNQIPMSKTTPDPLFLLADCEADLNVHIGHLGGISP